MKFTLLCLALLGGALAVPNGYYHQEYNYKTSSSSFKNNELQHKTDDQGYYKKDGDLEGRTRPRVDSNSEHSEYVNPNLRNSNYHGYGGADLTSNGHMLAQNSYGSLGSNQLTEGLASSDHVRGYSSGNTYGHSYTGSSSSNLRSIMSQLQSNMEQDLLDSIRNNNYGYATHRNTIEEMESDVRRNMTERIDNELMARYGQQTIRSGNAYSIANGRIQNTANYNDQELSSLKMQMENSLLDKLRREYSQGYSNNARYSSSNRYQYDYTSSTTARPVYQTLYPTLTTPRYSDNSYYHTSRNQYPNIQSSIRYSPVTNPESITNIASSVQSRLDTRLNEILSEAQQKYSGATGQILTNLDVVLDRLRQEVRNNITYLLDENIRRNYGNQELRDGYYYTIGSNGQISSQSNYAASDLDNLRSQMERNLIEKLNRDFESYRTSWSQSNSWSGHSNYNSNYDSNYGTATQRYVHTTPRYTMSNQNQYGGSSSNLYGGSSSSTYGGSQSSSSYGYGVKGSGSGISSGSSIAQLQSRLQNDLSRQLQQALTQRTHVGYTSAGGYSPESYDTRLQRLTDEMNRNITRNIQEYSASGSYGAYGDYSEAQMAALKNQLESNLMRQLQQGLQQSFQTHQSYSSSSSGSYNRPVRGFQNYQIGQYNSGIDTMQGDDPNALNTNRAKRSSDYYRSRPLNLGGHSGYNAGYSSGYSYPRYISSTSSRPQQQEELGQQVEDDWDLTQQVEDSGIPQIGQEEDNSDLTQQEEESGFGKIELQPQSQIQVGQQEDDSDLTQQIEDSGFGKLQVSSQNQQTVGQQEDNSDLTQQVEDLGFRKPQVGNQQTYPMGRAEDHAQATGQVGQVEDDSDLTQQVQNSGFGKLQVGNQNQAPTGQHPVYTDLTQQVEDTGFGKPHVGNQNQYAEDSDLTQQVEDSGFGQLQVGNQNQPPTGQYPEDSDLTQQVEDSGFGKLQVGNQNRVPTPQYPVDLDLTQQLEDSGFGKLPRDDVFSYLGTPGHAPVTAAAPVYTQNHGFGQTVRQQPNTYPSSVGLTEEVHGTVDGTGSVQLAKLDVDEIVGKLEQTLSAELQRIVDNERTNNRKTDISEVVQRLQAKITLPGRLTQQQLTYVKGKVQSYMAKEIQKHFGDDYNYRFSWVTSTSTKPNYRNTFLLEGFNTQKFSDFTSTQIDISQSTETSLSVLLSQAIQHIPSGLSNTELQNQQRRLRQELLQNITQHISHLPPEQSTLFTTLQIRRIKSQLENDLKQQLYQELYTPMTPHSIGRDNLEDEVHTEIATSHKPLTPQSHVLEPIHPQPSTTGLKSWNINGFNEKQVHFCEYIENTLTKQLNEAIEIEYTFNYSPNRQNPQIVYQHLLKDLEKNVTARFESYSQYFLKNYMNFDSQQLESIKSQVISNLELKLRKQLELDNGRGDMRPDEVGPTKPTQINRPFPPLPAAQHKVDQQQEEVGQQQEEVGQQQEEVDQQQEEMGQQEIVDTFEKLEPLKPLDQIPIVDVIPNQRPTVTAVYPQSPQQYRPYDEFGQPQIVPLASQTGWKITTTRRPVNSNQFLQTEIEQQQTDVNNQGPLNQNYPRLPNSNQPDTGLQFGITSQGQIITQEQTRGEAESNADALVDLLRNKQTSPKLKPVEENANPSFQHTPYGGPTHHNHNRPTYGGHTSSHGGYSPHDDDYPSNYGTNAPSQPSRPHLSYGHQEILDGPLEQASGLERVRPSYAHVATHAGRPRPSNNIGVKGGHRYSTIEQVNVEELSSTAASETPVEATTVAAEELPWWKKFGNKVKEGTLKLKEKIVG